MSAHSLQQRIAHGAAWAFASSWARIAVSLLAFAVIARLIGPADYGLNTGAGALALLGQVLVGPAAGEVVVQRQDLAPRVLSAYFWLLLGIASALFGAVAAGAGSIAALFDAPPLQTLLLLYALSIPLTALQTVPEALLGAQLQFRTQALAGGAGVIVGSTVGIALALGGAGAWSLAALQLVQALVQTLVLWRGSGWRPAAGPQWRALPPLLRYSSSSVAVRLLTELDNQLPKVFIGSILGVVALGYYGMARRIFDLLKDLLIVPLNTVALPSIAKARARGEDVPALFGAALRMSTFIANPAFFGLIAIAPLLVPLLFGAGWQAAVLPLQLMALLGLRSAVNSFNGAALRGYGQPLQQVGVAALGLALLLAAVPLAARLGLVAAVLAVVLRSYATWPLSALLVQRLGVFPARRQFTVGLRSLLAAALMCAAVMALQAALAGVLAPAPLLLLLLCLAAGVLLYAGIGGLLAPAEAREGLQLLRRLAARRARPAPVAGTA